MDIAVKEFHLPLSPLRRLLSLPAQAWFAITGLIGLAHYSRHIVLLRPRSPISLAIRHGKGGRSEQSNHPAMENGVSVSLSEWVEKNVPSLLGPFTPSWWLSK